MTWRCIKCGWEAGLWGSLNSQRRVRCLDPFYSSRYCSQNSIVRALSHAQCGGILWDIWKTYTHVEVGGNRSALLYLTKVICFFGPSVLIIS